MHRPNDSTSGRHQPMEGASEWGSYAAQDAWRPDSYTNRGFRRDSRDNDDMEQELNAGLNFNIYDHNDQRHQNRAVDELHSGENRLDRAGNEVQRALRALRNGDSEGAASYLRDSLRDIRGGVEDLRDGLRHNPNDSRQDRHGERNVREGLDEISDSRHHLSKAFHLIRNGREDEAMQLLRKGRRELNNGRDDVDYGVDNIEDASRRGRHGGHRQPGAQKPGCEQPEVPTPPCETPEEPKNPCEPKPPCETPEEPETPCEPEPPCETPEEPETPCEPEPPCEPEFYDKAERHLIWGDPHIQDAKGNNIEDQIEANKNVLLVKTSDGASITGHTTSFDNPELRAKEGHDITVFDKEVVNLGDGQRIMFQADGKAFRVDNNGNLGEAVKDDEVISSRHDANDKVTFDADTRSLNFNFVGDAQSTISGVLTGNLDSRGNYVNSEVKQSTGLFGGFMPALKADFTGITVDSKTGAGAFDPTLDGRQRTNADFFVDSLFDE